MERKYQQAERNCGFLQVSVKVMKTAPQKRRWVACFKNGRYKDILCNMQESPYIEQIPVCCHFTISFIYSLDLPRGVLDIEV